MTNSDRIRAAMAEILGQPPTALPDEAPLASVVAGSFALVEMIIELQERFGVRFRQVDMEGVATVGDLLELFVERIERSAA